MADNYPPAAPERATCGCYVSEVEEKHRRLEADQRRRFAWFIADLLSIKTLTEPRLPTLLPPGDLTEGHIRRRWRYFKWLYAEDPQGFPAHVRNYERAHKAVWLKPPCERGIALLHPGDVEGLPVPKDDEPRRRHGGGRHRNLAIQRRNERIKALSAAGTSTLGIAQTLDNEDYAILESWAGLLPEGQRTWVHALLDPKTKRRVEKFFTKHR